MRKYIAFDTYFQKNSFKSFKKKKPVLKYILIIICLAIIFISGYILINWIIDNWQIEQINQNITKNIVLKDTSDNGKLVNPPQNKKSDYYYYAALPFYQVDFSNLIFQNQDTVGFIHMNNTNINFPIVQANDNDYYLNHTFDKSKNKAGWIFMDYRNDSRNLDDNTIIYGHSRVDRTMFGSLRNVLTSYWQNNPANYVIFLSTLKENMIFQIFSIYTIKSESYYITTDFKNNEEKANWLKTMQKRNIAPINTEVNINDKILTLSTCQNNFGGRLVIQAKLIKKQDR